MDDGASGRSPGDGTPGGEDATEIKTFLIADVRGYTLFTQERGDEVAAKLAAKFAMLARSAALVIRTGGGTLSRPVNDLTSLLPKPETCQAPGAKNGSGTASGEST
jgi:hypothetical protein